MFTAICFDAFLTEFIDLLVGLAIDCRSHLQKGFAMGIRKDKFGVGHIFGLYFIES